MDLTRPRRVWVGMGQMEDTGKYFEISPNLIALEIMWPLGGTLQQPGEVTSKVV